MGQPTVPPLAEAEAAAEAFQGVRTPQAVTWLMAQVYPMAQNGAKAVGPLDRAAQAMITLMMRSSQMNPVCKDKLPPKGHGVYCHESQA